MFNNNSDFYPTPTNIIDKMLQGIDFKLIQSVLEPSAGDGRIVEAITNKFKYSRSSYYNREAKWDIDTIEIDENLQHILKGKNFRIVHNDFLTYNSLKRYDLIIANPPFSSGDKHLLKMIEMQKDGGIISCLLNAETLKNPYNNTRKDLTRKLEELNAEIEYINNSFIGAERSTSVEVALIRINIPKTEHNSVILDSLKQEEKHQEEHNSDYSSSTLINADFIKGIIERYNFEVKAGLKLIEEYNKLKPFMLKTLNESEYNNNSVLKLELESKDNDGNCNLENSYIKQIRMKYWKALFTSDQFMGLFTSNLRQKYYSRVNELKDYDFSLYNIYTIKIELNKEMIQGVEDTILDLFEEFSHKHHWYNETSNNIHYYNGWKTNKAYKINKKIIIPLSCYSWSGSLDYGWNVKEKLTDIEKVFNYLDNGTTEEINLEESLKMAQHYQETKKIETKYFYITFYKKGTCHLEFKNLDLLHRFNIFGSQKKGWLPPSYSKKTYNNMTQEEQNIIDEFEGRDSYNKVINNPNKYIFTINDTLLLGEAM